MRATFESPSVELVQDSDVRKMAWVLSRPYIKSEDDVNLDEISRIDLQCNTLRWVAFKMRSSIAFRELISVLRPYGMWAQSSRVNDLSLTVFSNEGGFRKIAKEIDAKWDIVQNHLAAGVDQDTAKMHLPLAALTEYVVAMDFRSWVYFLKSLKELQPEFYDVYGVHIESALGIKLADFSGYRQAINREQWEDILSCFDSWGRPYRFHTATVEKHSMMPIVQRAQLARHQSSLVYDNLWFMGIDDLLTTTLGTPIEVIESHPLDKYVNTMSARSCWIAQWGLWSEEVEYYMDTYDRGFDKVLPCKAKACLCPFRGEHKGRETGGDRNPLCPILFPEHKEASIARRIEMEGETTLLKRWKHEIV